MKRKIKSVCGRYIAIYEKNNYDNASVKDMQTGIIYIKTHDHTVQYRITGYSAYGDQDNYFGFKYFTLRFVKYGKDANGNFNTVVNKYSACFKRPKDINYRKSTNVNPAHEKSKEN